MPTSFELTPMMMREIIMEHYSNPSHKHVPTSDGYTSIHTDSTNCIDNFDIYIKCENGKIVDALWDGVACTISSASTDILCDRMIGSSYKDAIYTIEQYQKMIQLQEYDASVLDEAIVFINTGKQAARIHCATMGWDAMKELIKKEGE